jgi:hypothetical protein
MGMQKIMYKPVGIAAGVFGSMLAGMAFKQVWRAIAHEDHAPGAGEEDREWSEILLAATLHGAIFALVKAAMDRGGMTAMRRMTGAWPA